MTSSHLLDETQKAFWQRMLEEQKHSGLNQKQFCQQHDLKFYTFQYCKYRLLKATPTTKPAPKQLKKLPDLVPVEIAPPPPASPAPAIEVRWPNGCQLRLQMPLTAAVWEQLMQLGRRPAC